MRVHLCGVRGSTAAPGADFLRYGGHTSCLALAHDGDERRRWSSTRAPACAPSRRCWASARSAARSCSRTCTGTTCRACRSSRPATRHGAARAGCCCPSSPTGRTPCRCWPGRCPRRTSRSRPADLRGAWTFGTIAPGERTRGGLHGARARDPAQGRPHLRLPDQRRQLDAHLHRPTTARPRSGPARTAGASTTRPRSSSPRGSDALLHDAQLLPEELTAEARFGHSSVEYPVALGVRAGARRRRPRRTIIRNAPTMRSTRSLLGWRPAPR